MKKTFFILTLIACGYSYAVDKVKDKIDDWSPKQKKKIQEFVTNDSWHFQSTSTTDGKFYTKGIVLMLDSDTYDFWLKIESPPLAECKGKAYQTPYELTICENKSKSELGSQVSHVNLSCSNKKYKMLESVFYNQNGEVMGSSEVSGKWSTIYPDSVMERIHYNTCK
jgi:hypothetical protein